MQPFGFQRATAVEAATAAIATHPQGRFVAGGTSLVDLMKLGVECPDLLVDINGLAWTRIAAGDDGGYLGALARNSDVAMHPGIRDRYPVLAEALLSGASPQLRNMATVGGNLCQRPRCAYFRDVTFACNRRDPGSGCAAYHGNHAGHAVLGTSRMCMATHPSDMCVALVALGAEVETLGPQGARRIPIEDFHRLPGDMPHLENDLAPGELVTAVTLPPLPVARHSLYLKVRDRAEFDFALASVAAALLLEDGHIREVRLALGGVATKPWRAHAAERVLRGQRPAPALFAAAADAELEAARPHGENRYKVPLARRLIVRALERLCQPGGSEV